MSIAPTTSLTAAAFPTTTRKFGVPSATNGSGKPTKLLAAKASVLPAIKAPSAPAAIAFLNCIFSPIVFLLQALAEIGDLIAIHEKLIGLRN
jgi:hypothetical protein